MVLYPLRNLGSYSSDIEFSNDLVSAQQPTGNSTDHNLIGNADGSNGLGIGNSGDLLGSTANLLNPHLGTLNLNGGPTQTLALLSGSPAINAGDNNAQTTTGSFDQRGKASPAWLTAPYPQCGGCRPLIVAT
jgi:hypothetical protein